MNYKQIILLLLTIEYGLFTNLGECKTQLLSTKNSIKEVLLEYIDYLKSSLKGEKTFSVYGNYAIGTIENLIEIKTELEDTLNMYDKELSVYFSLNKTNSVIYNLFPTSFTESTFEYIKNKLKTLSGKNAIQIDEIFNKDYFLKKELIFEYNGYLEELGQHSATGMKLSKEIISTVYSLESFKVDIDEHIFNTKEDLNKKLNLFEQFVKQNNKFISDYPKIPKVEDRIQRSKTAYKCMIPSLFNIQNYILEYYSSKKELDKTIKNVIKLQNEEIIDLKEGIEPLFSKFGKYNRVQFAISRFLEHIGVTKHVYNKYSPKSKNKIKIEQMKADINMKTKQNLIEDESKIVNFSEQKIDMEMIERDLLDNIYKLYKNNILQIKEYIMDMNLFLDKYQIEIKRGYYILQYNKLQKNIEDELIILTDKMKICK